jgi:AraC-like DNA-binding protein
MIYVPPETPLSFQSSETTGERLICMIDHKRWRAATTVRSGATLCNAQPLCNEILFYLLLHPTSRCVRTLLSALVQVLAESIEAVEQPSLLEVTHLDGGVRDVRIRTVLEIFRKQLATPIRMRDAAHEAGLSVRNLSRLFLAEIGMSPKQVLTQYRIAAASERLLAGDSVTEAAFASGYESLAQFVMTFRRLTGQRPSEIARRGRKQ